MSNVVQFPKRKLEHRFTNSMQDGWLCCVPYYAQLYRIAYRAKHHRLLGAPKDE